MLRGKGLLTSLQTKFLFKPPLPSELGVAVRAYRDLIVDKVLAYYVAPSCVTP